MHDRLPPKGKVWIYRFLCLCVCVFCVRVCTVTDFFAEDTARGANFAPRFIGIQGRESHISGNFAPTKAQNRTNPCGPRSGCSSDRDATFVEYRAACRRRIGMCGYTAVPEDGRTCYYYYYFFLYPR